MPNLAIFASGAGSNAAQIMEYFENNSRGLRISLLICNRKEAGIYDVAKQYQVPIQYVPNAEIEAADDLISLLNQYSISWIVLAGFLRRIPEKLVQHFSMRIFNIHPSLLPAFGGAGMYGMRVHQAVLEHKASETGISIHLVNEQYDKGEIIFQKAIPVPRAIDIHELASAVQKLEHAYFGPIIQEHILKQENGN